MDERHGRGSAGRHREHLVPGSGGWRSRPRGVCLLRHYHWRQRLCFAKFPRRLVLYIATTYDGGQTWTIVNPNPNDPIQRGGICGSGTCRNLLDFFDATIDKEGRLLVGYEDGCITAACVQGTAGNDFKSKNAIARQLDGRRLFAAFDVELTSVVSRKTHGAAGPFDILLPITGTAGIECRTPDTGNAYQLIFTFSRNITDPGSAIKQAGNVTVGTATIGPLPNQVTVPLTDVTNAQHVLVNLNYVHDAAGAILFNMTARMDVLLGDVNASGRVDSGDVSLVRQQTLQTVTTSNFREDINASGRIDAGDVSISRQQALTALPTPP